MWKEGAGNIQTSGQGLMHTVAVQFYLTGVWNAAHQIGINAEGSVELVSPGSRTGWRMSSFEVKPVRTASGGAEREMAMCCVEGSTAWNVGVGPGWAHHFSVSARCSKWTWAKGSESKRGVWLIQTSVSGLLLPSQGCSSSLAHTGAASWWLITEHHTFFHTEPSRKCLSQRTSGSKKTAVSASLWSAASPAAREPCEGAGWAFSSLSTQGCTYGRSSGSTGWPTCPHPPSSPQPGPAHPLLSAQACHEVHSDSRFTPSTEAGPSVPSYNTREVTVEFICDSHSFLTLGKLMLYNF